MPGQRTRLINDIHSLLALEPTRTSLGHVEDTLTTGYAHALALEVEQLRLKRRLLKLAAEPESRRGRASEAKELAGVLAGIETELHQLRLVLVSLRDRARELRAAA